MLDERIYGTKRRKSVTLDGASGKVVKFPRKKSALGAGPAPQQNFVYDPFTGLPIADPSGVLQQSGYETAPVDTSVVIGDNIVHAVEDTAALLTKGIKYAIYGAAALAVFVVLAEGSKLTRDAFGKRRA